jgi:hypothetical protein
MIQSFQILWLRIQSVFDFGVIAQSQSRVLRTRIWKVLRICTGIIHDSWLHSEWDVNWTVQDFGTRMCVLSYACRRMISRRQNLFSRCLAAKEMGSRFYNDSPEYNYSLSGRGKRSQKYVIIIMLLCTILNLIETLLENLDYNYTLCWDIINC